MEHCICNNYPYGDEVKLPHPTWKYVKDGFMGSVYQCSSCGCLWFKTMSSGIIGMPVYRKARSDMDFGTPSPSAPLVELSPWNDELERTWVQFLSTLPKGDTPVMCDAGIPEDIIRTLYFVLGNDQLKVSAWLNGHVILQGNIFVPIKLLEQDGSGNKLRFLILKTWMTPAER